MQKPGWQFSPKGLMGLKPQQKFSGNNYVMAGAHAEGKIN